jgi:hypothetical protein
LLQGIWLFTRNSLHYNLSMWAIHICNRLVFIILLFLLLLQRYKFLGRTFIGVLLIIFTLRMRMLMLAMILLISGTAILWKVLVIRKPTHNTATSSLYIILVLFLVIYIGLMTIILAFFFTPLNIMLIAYFKQIYLLYVVLNRLFAILGEHSLCEFLLLSW